jgi:hypothetical protein
MLFSPSCSSLIPEGNIFFDAGDVAGVKALSARGGLSPADGFWEAHGHFIMAMFYHNSVQAYQTSSIKRTMNVQNGCRQDRR